VRQPERPRIPRHRVPPWTVGATLLVFSTSVLGCRGNRSTPSEQATAPGPPTLDVVHVVQRPIDVTLSMPGQLDPYESVAVYPKVTGFVKRIRVDR